MPIGKLFLSMQLIILSMSSRAANSVECFCLNPLDFYRIICSSLRKHSDFQKNTFLFFKLKEAGRWVYNIWQMKYRHIL